MFFYAVVLCTLLGASWCADLIFPPGFKFGAATASYQVEGAWNVSDKGESIWDRFSHTHPEAILDRSNGDIACDSYQKWREDVQLAKNLGVHFYRISIAWPRVMPSGFANQISNDGVAYYSNLLDELLLNGIEPVVTLYHWDLPQPLQDLGGWTNPLIVEWFSDYARVVYSLFADRVKTWITINEGVIICDLASSGTIAPGIKDYETSPFLCNKHILLAHAAGYRIYDEEFKSQYNGKVSISTQMVWFMPASDKPKDVEMADLANQFGTGKYSHPIFSADGGWPPSVEMFMEKKSKEEGYVKSKLIAFSKEEIEFVKGTYDFFALNHYTSRIATASKPGDSTIWPLHGSYDLNILGVARPEWEHASATDWFYVYPEGLRDSLRWITQQYGNISILITENGYPTSDSKLEDHDRVNYYREYLRQVLLSIKKDGVKVEGYTAWTLIDNFEWMDGYASKFGLHNVDFNDPERKRTPRLSAHFYKQVIEKHSLDF